MTKFKSTLATLTLAITALTMAEHYHDNTRNDDQPSRAYLGSANLPASGIAISGFSPVSYFDNKVESGSIDYAVDHDGVTYLLTSDDQVRRFKANPDKYVPAYGGWCAFGMSIQDKFPIDPRRFKIVDGRLLLFLRNESVDALQLWNQGDEADNRKKAGAHWKTVKN